MINEHILNRFPKSYRDWLCNDISGQMFYHKVLAVKGCHISLIGQPDSGKTTKMKWLIDFLKFMETIVIIDTGKDEEIASYFFMGKPVNIIIPHGMKIDIKGCGENYKVQTAYLPQQVWDLVEKDSINIISVIRYFYSEKERARFYSALFKSLSYRSAEEFFRDTKGIERMTVQIDEAQRIVPSTAFTNDQECITMAQDVTSNILEVRAYGVRLILGTQDYVNVYPAARRNMPARVFCHGAVVKSDESKQLHRLAEYSQNYAKWEGLFVFPDGDYYPRTCPWTFPNYPKPRGAKIRYSGKVDLKKKDDGADEQIPDVGIFHDKLKGDQNEKRESYSRIPGAFTEG